MSDLNIKQKVGFEVRKVTPENIREQYLENPIQCKKCGNQRRWKIRCEYCGLVERIDSDDK